MGTRQAIAQAGRLNFHFHEKSCATQKPSEPHFHFTAGDELFFEDNRPIWEQTMQELARLVHNYVAAGVSVVDHARALHGELHKDSGAFADFKAEVDSRFFKNRSRRSCGSCAIISRMLVHLPLEQGCDIQKGAPAIELSTTMPKGAFRTSRWEPEAKAFLGGIATEHIDVGLVVEEYRLVVEQFFEWMYGRLRAIHKPDFQVVAGYQRKIFELQKGEFESDIRQRLSVYEKGRGSIVDV